MSLCYLDGLAHFTPFIPLFTLYRSLYITKKESVREPDESGEAGQSMSPKDAIKHIVEEIDAKLLGGGNQCLKGVPSSNPLAGPGLQTDIALAHPKSRSQFSGIVVQKDFRMGKDHQQMRFLCQRPPLALIQEFVATFLPEELIKCGFQRGSLGRIRMVAVVQEALIQLPEAFVKVLQEANVVSKPWDQGLVVAVFMTLLGKEGRMTGQRKEKRVC
jgi:hypothetical protein